MQTLRGLADDGRTVVVVTHSVAHLDSVRPAARARPRRATLAYFGPPARGAGLLRPARLRRHVPAAGPRPGDRLGPAVPAVAAVRALRRRRPGYTPLIADRSAPAAAPPQQRFGTQFAVLCRRYLSVIAADRQFTRSRWPCCPLVLTPARPAWCPATAGLSMRGRPRRARRPAAAAAARAGRGRGADGHERVDPGAGEGTRDLPPGAGDRVVPCRRTWRRSSWCSA